MFLWKRRREPCMGIDRFNVCPYACSHYVVLGPERQSQRTNTPRENGRKQLHIIYLLQRQVSHEDC